MKLEQSIAEWRKQMLAVGIKSPVPLDELENHLREEIEREIKPGINEQRAFEIAARQIGQPKPLIMEFKKIDSENWNRPLAWCAWVLFVVSFFLPAHRYGGWGWQCAWGSAGGFFSSGFWQDILKGDLIDGDFHLTLLTFANLLMLVSPFLLPRFSKNLRFTKCCRAFSLLALILVWSFIFRLLTENDRENLKIGCYVWAAAFLPLFLATLKSPSRRPHAVAN